MIQKLKEYFIGHRLKSTDDVFEKAKIDLIFNFTFFLSILAIPFVIQLYVKELWYHLYINIFEICSLGLIFISFRSKIPIKYIGVFFVFVDGVMSSSSLVFQNGNFDLQAGMWSLLMAIYTFFVLGKKWGLASTIFVVLLFIGCIPFNNEMAFLNFNLPSNQIVPSAPAFIIFPFSLIIYIVAVFVNTNTVAQNLLNQQKSILENQKNEIISSITYAKRIQQAKLPPIEQIQTSFKNSFVLFKPKDIVSGDFYFFQEKENLFFVAAADCTGHGVPGAILSMICSEKLEEALTQSSDTAEILKILNRGIKSSLKQSDNENSTKDGMDISLCSLNKLSREINYSGANRPLWIVRNSAKELEEIKATKKSIGGFTSNEQHFENHQLNLNEGDTIYIFTDGYADQFGEKSGKKIMTKKLKEIFLEIQHKSMNEQKKYLEGFVENWRGNFEQIDDILIIGIKL